MPHGHLGESHDLTVGLLAASMHRYEHEIADVIYMNVLEYGVTSPGAGLARDILEMELLALANPVLVHASSSWPCCVEAIHPCMRAWALLPASFFPGPPLRSTIKQSTRPQMLKPS